MSERKVLETARESVADAGPIHFENDRLVIRAVTERNLDGLKAMRSDRKVYRFEPTFLAELQGTPEEALRTIMSMKLHKDRQCILGVYEKTDPDALIGLAEFYDYKPSGKVISIGYRFLSKYWGKGIGTSCTHALLSYIQRNTQVELVTAHVITANKASARCLLKNGFEHLITKTEDWGYGRPSTADVYTFDCLRFISPAL